MAARRRSHRAGRGRSSHRSKELAGADRRDRSGHGRSLCIRRIDAVPDASDGMRHSHLPMPSQPMTTTQRWTMLAVVLGSAIVFLDATIVNVALATIGRELPGAVLGTLEGLTYVTSGYFATLAALLVLSGALADYYGRRRVFVIGLAGFGATSALCGLAPTSSCWWSRGSSRARRARCSSRARSRSSPRCSRDRAGPARSASGRRRRRR